MIYMFEFLGLLAIAVALAASPFLIRLLESIFPADLSGRRSAASYGFASGAVSKERSEMHDEIRRATTILQTERRAEGFSPASTKK